MLQMIRALSGGRVLYLSVPLTTGWRELRILEQGDVATLQAPEWDKRNELVFEANKREAWVYAELARARFPMAVVVDPSSLDHPDWGQEDYNNFWADLITEHASAVVAAPGWAFSRGARLEVDLAVRLGVPVISLDGKRLEVPDIAAADREAHDAVSAIPRLADYLAPMVSLQRLPAEQLRAQAYADSPVTRALGHVVGWLRGERKYQLQKFGIEEDDRHTRQGLTEDSWWWRQLTTYLHRGAIRLGVETPGGRQALAKYAATACGLAESVLRCYGPVWAETPSPPAHVDAFRPGREADALFRWLIVRRAAVLDDGETGRDDAWLNNGFGQDSSWWHACMTTLRGAQAFSLGSPQGRRAVGEILLRSCALNEAVSRRYGPLPPSGVPSGYALDPKLPA